MKLPRMLHTAILRAPMGKANVTRLDVAAVRAMPGIVDVLTPDDVKGKVEPWGDICSDLLIGDRMPFAMGEVSYYGQEVAAVLAETMYEAQDGLEAIQVDYEELPAVIDPEAAAQPDAPVVNGSLSREFGYGNVFDSYRLRTGDIDKAFEEADLVVKGDFSFGGQVAASMEPHGCVVDYDPSTQKLTVYSTTQSVFLVRDLLAKALHIARNNIHVLTLTLGGGYGQKLQLFGHEVIASIFAMRTGRPVKIVLDREEVFSAGGRRASQVRHSELMLKKDGTLVGYRENFYHNAGANSHWANQIVRIGTQIGMLPYKTMMENLYIDGNVTYTNTSPVGALRGFGTPQSVFCKETLIEYAAQLLGMDPLEMRLKNSIRADECPYTTPAGQKIDTTSMDICIEKVAEASGWQAARRAPKPYVGVGNANTMKYTSCRHPAFDSDLDAVRMRLETDGTVTVFSSGAPQSQGHETFMSQIVADELGVDFEMVKVVSADTELVPWGLGTWGSRAAAITGSALMIASGRIREKLYKIAAHIMEAPIDDLVVSGNKVHVRGNPDQGMWIQQLAQLCAYRTHQLPPDVEPGGIEAIATFDTPTDREDPSGRGNFSLTYSAHSDVAKVEVDPGTGLIRVIDYFQATDCGTVINPLIVAGQHQGALEMGQGQALGEDLIYDESGRLLNGSFRDYYFPVASDFPDLNNHIDVPAPSEMSLTGAKSVGEGATVTPPAAIANAVHDATGIFMTEIPITAEKMCMALREKERRGVEQMSWPPESIWVEKSRVEGVAATPRAAAQE
jgi:carbon-monoxide dehydrogenase large subunit